MKLPLYQVDAFTHRRFHGNPAAVCPLEQWLPDETLQAIARENNLSETAYYVRQRLGGSEQVELRWFTPAVEVDLCGHATLAAAYVMFALRKELDGDRVQFQTRSGALTVERDGNRYALNFPSRPPKACDVHPLLTEALGPPPEIIMASRDYLCVYPSEEAVLQLTPDMGKLAQIDRFAVIVTAPGSTPAEGKDGCDFVSRFFAPAQGVAEDPVTGSAHCTLIPYWSRRLSKKHLFARQCSARGGELWCEDLGERVRISGQAASYLEGTITI
ncbi:MAG: PhzF family phenazine biosynthesis protein [Bryobacteraceae bacterium]